MNNILQNIKHMFLSVFVHFFFFLSNNTAAINGVQTSAGHLGCVGQFVRAWGVSFMSGNKERKSKKRGKARVGYDGGCSIPMPFGIVTTIDNDKGTLLK